MRLMSQGADLRGSNRNRKRWHRTLLVQCAVLLAIVGVLAYGFARFRSDGVPSSPTPLTRGEEKLEEARGFDRSEAGAEEPTPPAAADSEDIVDSVLGAVQSTLGRKALPLEIAHLDDQIRLALDREAAPIERIGAIRWLGAFGGVEALGVLERLLTDPKTASLRRIAAAELGRFDDSEARVILERTAHALSSSEDSADAALRVSVLEALLVRGSNDARDSLRALVLDEDATQREAAARALLATGAGDPTDWLLSAIDAGTLSPEVAIEALAEAPWLATESFFRDFIGDEDRPVEIRLEALETLSDAEEAASFVFEVAAESADPVMRAGAYDALALQFDDRLAPQIAPRLFVEEDPMVRASLYEYLTMNAQELGQGASKEPTLERMLSESQPETRLGAARYLAQLTRTTADPAYSTAFETNMIPWLVEAAEAATSPAERRRSTGALALSGLPAARGALERLSRSNNADLAAMAEAAIAREGLWANP